MHAIYRIGLVSFLIHAIMLLDVPQNFAFQSSCAKEFACSSLAVMTAGATSVFTITSTDYPGITCNLGSEMFGFNLKSFSGNSSLAARSNSQWSVTPPHQFVIPLTISTSGIYSAEVVRYGKSSVFAGKRLDLTVRFALAVWPFSTDSFEQGVASMQRITRTRF